VDAAAVKAAPVPFDSETDKFCTVGVAVFATLTGIKATGLTATDGSTGVVLSTNVTGIESVLPPPAAETVREPV
jgi:hypothetical protein